VNNLESIRASDFLYDLREAEAEENRQRKELGLNSYAPAVKIEDLSRDIEAVLEDIRERLVPWEVMFEALIAYKAKNGNCNVPQRYSENPSLGTWLNNQRQVWRMIKDKSNLPERLRRLEERGVIWDVISANWERKFDELCAYKEKHGDCNVPENCADNIALSVWVQVQRNAWKKLNNKSNLPERLKRLEKLGFNWEVNTSKWEKTFAELRAYKDKLGNCNVPARYPEYPLLGSWLSIQRKSWKRIKDKSNLPERLRRLEELGVVWDVSSANWEKMFEELRVYKEKYGDCNVPKRFRDNPALSIWVSSQRYAWKKIKDKSNLPERLRRLEEMGIIWDVFSAQWENMFKGLCAYKEKHGDCNVPVMFIENPSLGQWVSDQRKAWKRMKDKSNLPERLRRLEELGFQWRREL
jgi:hypothetical protein